MKAAGVEPVQPSLGAFGWWGNRSTWRKPEASTDEAVVPTEMYARICTLLKGHQMEQTKIYFWQMATTSSSVDREQ